MQKMKKKLTAIHDKIQVYIGIASKPFIQIPWINQRNKRNKLTFFLYRLAFRFWEKFKKNNEKRRRSARYMFYNFINAK